jgi:beta-glucosidase
LRAKRRHEFQPVVLRLEDRRVFSHGAGPVLVPARVAAVSALASAPTAPEPGNTYLSLTDWMSLHREYAARARRHGNAVVFLGDSMVYLWGDPTRKALPGMLAPVGLQSWQQDIAPDRAANFGIIGDQTQNLLWRVEHGELAGRPRVAVVWVGVNNLLGGQTPEEAAAGVAAVVAAVRSASPTTRVLLLGLLPPGPGFVPGPGLKLAPEVRQVNALIAGLSGGPVTYLDPGAGFLGPGGTLLPGLIQTGSVHPTGQGYAVLSQEVQPVIRQLLSEPRYGDRSAAGRRTATVP